MIRENPSNFVLDIKMYPMTISLSSASHSVDDFLRISSRDNSNKLSDFSNEFLSIFVMCGRTFSNSFGDRASLKETSDMLKKCWPHPSYGVPICRSNPWPRSCRTHAELNYYPPEKRSTDYYQRKCQKGPLIMNPPKH